jgi:hypothetical protein
MDADALAAAIERLHEDQTELRREVREGFGRLHQRLDAIPPLCAEHGRVLAICQERIEAQCRKVGALEHRISDAEGRIGDVEEQHAEDRGGQRRIAGLLGVAGGAIAAVVSHLLGK